ncbi:hypothetical protein SAMN05660489_00895 [Pseudomonas sp. LAMO17WK12:I10]|uniref:hypothetical protein n=1 Tax=unclassified Pseudomonas TaxID=196821 RepID=UPI000BD1D2AA|nr:MULTISPECIES: hypothetical protein [unclassified Pseudomonas]PXX75019.1 hypothetical protein H160_01299 [Pseudomonas sp. LAMO17WK12:I9]SNY16876.1 hypothetical protein SAMN05660489_00895 [Pseudomonas sp. LAMO17WK12:I10]
MNVMLCAYEDGQSTVVHLDYRFVPSDWLKREFPKHFELIEIVEARAQIVLGELGQPEPAAILD